MYAERSAFLGTHDYLYEHLPNARSISCRGRSSGHFGPLEQPELVAEHIAGVVRRATSSGRGPSVSDAPHAGRPGGPATPS